MTFLRKALKPYLVGVLISIVLLFGQAFVDLSLPNIMSEIVNVGIQQNGIRHASPSEISENSMQLMQFLMTEEEQAFVLDHYEWDEGVFVRDDSAISELDQIFGQATWTLLTFVQTQGSSGFDQESMAQLLPLIAQLTPDDVRNLRALNPVDEALMEQSSKVLTRVFYEELGMDLEAMQRNFILAEGALMIGLTMLGGVATVLVSLFASRISAGVARDMRHQVFAKIGQFSNEEIDAFSTASLITRCTNDISQIQMLVQVGIRMMFYAPILAIGGSYMALRQSVSLAWIIALAVAVLLILIVTVVLIVMPKFKKMQTLVDNLNLVTRENLSGLMVIRAFATQDHETQRFEGANNDLALTSRFVNRAMNIMMPTMGLLMSSVAVLIVWVGARQISEATMQIGDMIAFIQYAMQIIMSFLMISMIFIFVPRAMVSYERVAEVLAKPISIQDPNHPESYPKTSKGEVVFDAVSFRYGGSDEDTVHDISFVAQPGQTTAIIGPTGSGKSTLANLLLRFYDVTSGSITIDGVDVRHVTQHDLRSRIGYVPQKGVLLSGTIASNLSYGKADANKDELIQAARIAQAEDFIISKEDGYESRIAQGGTNVSGGQKQRLSIGRALVKDPDIFVFDDSFSALDFKTDAKLRSALKENLGDATLIIVAQRVNTILNADQIIVLDEGKIVGKGTHRELLVNCPEYYEIASSQLSEKELAL